MEKLKFYLVDDDYVKYLQKAETEKRGFSRIPNLDYEKNNRKPKFFCGIVLSVEGKDYYVPVSSYKNQKPDNFLIYAANGKVTSSLRFNYMFPIPKELVTIRNIPSISDMAYKRLLLQELECCINNQSHINILAERTYKRVLLGKDKGLIVNSCDFILLEEKCLEYCKLYNLEIPLKQSEKNDAPLLSTSDLENFVYNEAPKILKSETEKDIKLHEDGNR